MLVRPFFLVALGPGPRNAKLGILSLLLTAPLCKWVLNAYLNTEPKMVFGAIGYMMRTYKKLAVIWANYSTS